jgi:hypothetical protein
VSYAGALFSTHAGGLSRSTQSVCITQVRFTPESGHTLRGQVVNHAAGFKGLLGIATGS